MTQADQRKARKSSYFAWADRAKILANLAGVRKLDVAGVRVTAWFAMPQSWTEADRYRRAGDLHRQKPDGDNVLKAVCDCLGVKDERIAGKIVRKRWTLGEPRVEVTVFTEVDFPC